MHHVLLSIDSPGRVTGHYDLSLVVLSVIIAIIASYATLDLASRVRLVEKLRFVWFACGAIAMGAGIWAMHYIGMAAYRLPVAVLYDLPTVAASLLAAILASAVALGAVSRPPLTRTRSIIGSLAMGTGIASMHYIGMAAMRMPAMCVYSLPIVTLSVLLAVLISFGALQIAFQFRNDNSLSWRKLGAAVILGLAIPIMHYVGMAAATFISLPQVRGNANSAVGSTSLGLFSISFVTVAMLGVVILQAASGRKLAFKEQELASKFLQTQIIFDSLSEGILVLDRNRNIVQINHSAKKMLGFLDSDLSHTEIAAAYQISLPNGDPLPPESWPSALALRGEFLQNCELNVTRSDHTKSILAEISTAPVLGPDGQLLQIIVSYRDVTKPREIDEARLRLAAIVESSEDAIIGKDGDGIVKSWNGGAEKLFGYTAQEMIGTSVRLLLPLDRLEEEEDILARIKRGEIVDHIETIRRRKNGQFINVSLTISPIRDSSGKVVGASKIVRNITEKKMMESRLFSVRRWRPSGNSRAASPTTSTICSESLSATSTSSNAA